MSSAKKKLSDLSTPETWVIPKWDVCPHIYNCFLNQPQKWGTTSVEISAEEKAYDEEDNTMRIDEYADMEAQQRKYLKARIWGIYDNRRIELESFFHIWQDNFPASPEELVERIKQGRITIIPANDNLVEGCCNGYRDIFNRIVWRNPKEPADNAGYEKALEVLEKAKVEAEDSVMLMPLDKALEAVKKFETANIPLK